MKHQEISVIQEFSVEIGEWRYNIPHFICVLLLLWPSIFVLMKILITMFPLHAVAKSIPEIFQIKLRNLIPSKF